MGKHSLPSNSKTLALKATAVAATGAAIATGTSTAANAGPSGGWDPIIACESGGNPTAKNPSSTASGLFQFINGTWSAYGGGEFADTAREASVKEQYIVAERAHAREGTRPWNASKHCWQGKTSKAKIHPPKKATQTLSLPPVQQKRVERPVEQFQVLPAVKPRRVPTTSVPTLGTEGNYTVKPGDTLSQIAVDHKVPGGWETVASDNRVVVEHPDWIFPGERLQLK